MGQSELLFDWLETRSTSCPVCGAAERFVPCRRTAPSEWSVLESAQRAIGTRTFFIIKIKEKRLFSFIECFIEWFTVSIFVIVCFFTDNLVFAMFPKLYKVEPGIFKVRAVAVIAYMK